MIENIPYINEVGNQILERLVLTDPSLFFGGRHLRDKLEDLAGDLGESPYSNKSINLETSLAPLNQIREDGPGTDADNAPILRQALSSVSPAEASDGLLWASINCFALSPYIPVRWGTSSLRRDDLQNTAFVKRHWLWQGTAGRTWNASARLWWLAELATRASEYSRNSVETLLEAMGNNVGLYHQLTSRTFLAANPQVVAAIYDVALDGSRHVFEKAYANQLMKALNMRAGNISFDVFDYDELYTIVESCLPPKERGATD